MLISAFQISDHTKQHFRALLVLLLISQVWQTYAGATLLSLGSIPVQWTKNLKFVSPTLECSMSVEDQNFGLTEKAFMDLVEDLKHGDTTVFQQIFLAHFQDCMRYLQSRHQANHDDAYDATMDTLLNFRSRLVEGKVSYGNMRFLFTQMASQHYFRLRKQEVKAAGLELAEDLLQHTDDTEWDNEDLVALKDAWSGLKESCQELLRLHFYQGLKLAEIADILGRNAGAVRKQKERCRNELIQLFTNQSKH